MKPETTSEKLEIEASRVLRAIEADIAKLKEKQDQLLKSINADKLTKEQLEREIGYKRRELEETEKAGAMVKQQYKAYQDRIIEMEDEQREIKKKIGDSEIVLKNLDKEAQQTKSDLIAARANARADVEAHIKAETANLRKLTKETDTVTKNLTELREQLAATAEQLKTAEQDVLDAHAALATVQGLLIEAEKKLKAIERDVADLTKQAEMLQGTIRNLEASIETLKQEKADLGANNDLLREEHIALTVSVEAKKAELAASESKLFAIARREDHVKQREAYVKELFERAGATYEEFNP